jgi:oligopeptide/dipeptide ABC transporter ATP-binding protein
VTSNLLTIDGLTVDLPGTSSPLRAVDGVSLVVPRNEVVGVVGESGCGKTMTALALLQLTPPGAIITGSALLGEDDILKLGGRQLRSLRGGRVSMIFQEPMTSLDPVFTIGHQLVAGIRAHQDLSRSDARDLAADLLDRVGIPEPRQRLGAYPHELSGGMRQRVMIGLALANTPELLIADEPTTALDVTVQAQVLELIDQLRQDREMSVLLISHDLEVIGDIAQRVAVMYAGEIVELAPVDTLFDQPMHPYTQGLLRSRPTATDTRRGQLHVIPGRVPALYEMPRGCRFADRCPYVLPRCREEHPTFEQRGERGLRCFNPQPN